MQRFQDQVAIVTGAARGIGLGIARKLGSEGARIVITDNDEQEAKRAVADLMSSDIEVLLAVGDVADESDVARAIDQTIDAWGRIDVLVNNAGIVSKTAYLWESSVDDLDRAYRTNLRGVFLYCQKVIPHMLSRGYGRIVNIASMAGKEGNPRMVPYSAAKAAVIGLTKSLGKELATRGILVNCVTPAVVRTRLLEQTTPEQIKYMIERIPMGRTLEVEEVANLVAWMASSECSFSTGAVFDISGGRATY
jgi:NAD(P)-dependent dehydrogenase (short-subunit alcohol dehydrogenase family)